MKTSTHADYRARKRIGVSNAEAVFQTALAEGRHQRDLKGGLRKFIDKGARSHRASAVIHKGFVYWYNPNQMVLITVIPLGQKWHKYLKEMI